MAKNKLFSGGTYGFKASGKWGKLNAAELAEKIMNEGFNPPHMDKSQKKALDEFYKKMAQETNEKIERLRVYLEQSGNRSSAYDDIMQSGGRIPEKTPKTFDEMRIQLKRMQFFDDDETSTPDGVESFYNDFEEQFSDDIDDIPDLSKKWTYLRRLQKYNPAIIEQLGGISETLNEIETQMINNNIDEWIVETLNSYEQAEKEKLSNYYANRKKL